MINGNIATIIKCDDEDESYLVDACNILQELRAAFEKVGNYNTTEIETLKATEHIIEKVLREEAF